jgi:branched-chain amino acid transport system ATP-binding protein
MSRTLLQVTDMHAGYGATEVLHGLTMTIEEGSITTLLGANGAGKTTTLRALSKMIKVRGQIQFDGQAIEGKSTEDIVRLGVAHVPDGRGTFGSLSTEENLQLGSYTRKDKQEAALDQEKMYTYFPRLKERRQQQAGTLSGGEQQMLAIARALMLRPRLLLMDEPSFGLAPLIVREIFDIMRTINQVDKVTILLVEQNAAMALDLAKYAYLLETGKLVLSGLAEDLKKDEAVRRSYLGH